MIESPMQRLPHRQRGFGLIEVLVALTILSVGMLGLAAMQLNSLHASRESLNKTIATIMVRDMNERAWAQQDKACVSLLQDWRSDFSDTDKFSADEPDPLDGGHLYSLIVRWGDNSKDSVELITFLPCEPEGEAESQDE